MKRPDHLDNEPGRGQLSFFPTPEFSPTLPDPASRRAAILAALRQGDRLTHIEALRRGWGWRLAADIHALKDEHGWPIQSLLIHNDGGNPIAEYWLPANEVRE